MKSDELKPQVDTQELKNQIADLDEKVEALNNEISDLKLRHAADTTNNQQRFAQKLKQAEQFASEKFARDLLPVLDALILAKANFCENTNQEQAKGLEMAIQIFEKNLKMHGIEAIEAEGQDFNPEIHVAVTMQESDKHEKNQVIQVLQTGYKIHDRVLRPATVIVAS